MTLRHLIHRLFSPTWEDLWGKAIRHASRANVHEVHHEWEQAAEGWLFAGRYLRAAYLAAPDINRRNLWDERSECLRSVARCADRARDSWAAVECVRGRVV